MKVFGCAAYVLKLPKPSKFEATAHDGIYLESLPHGTFRVLIHENEIYRIVESRDVTLDETGFPGVAGLVELMDEENDDSDFDDEEINNSSDEEDEMMSMNNQTNSEERGEIIETEENTTNKDA